MKENGLENWSDGDVDREATQYLLSTGIWKNIARCNANRTPFASNHIPRSVTLCFRSQERSCLNLESHSSAQPDFPPVALPSRTCGLGCFQHVHGLTRSLGRHRSRCVVQFHRKQDRKRLSDSAGLLEALESQDHRLGDLLAL